MTRKYTKHTKENLEPIIKSSLSYAEVLHKLGLRATGGNYKHLQINIDKFNLDISHMKHQASNQGKEFKPFLTLRKPASIKARLIKECKSICTLCGIFSWKGSPLVMEMDHIDGNNRNNTRENLRLLCPNCHSQTPTFRNRKRN